MSNTVSEVLQVENYIIIYYTCCMKLKKLIPLSSSGMSVGWSSGCHSALLKADLQPAA